MTKPAISRRLINYLLWTAIKDSFIGSVVLALYIFSGGAILYIVSRHIWDSAEVGFIISILFTIAYIPATYILLKKISETRTEIRNGINWTPSKIENIIEQEAGEVKIIEKNRLSLKLKITMKRSRHSYSKSEARIFMRPRNQERIKDKIVVKTI